MYLQYTPTDQTFIINCEQFPDLSKMSFPGKKTFHNMDRVVLEKRMKLLGSYMYELCQPNVVSTHHGLQDLLMTFLEQGDYDRVTGGPISSTVRFLYTQISKGLFTSFFLDKYFSKSVKVRYENYKKYA